MTSTRRRFYDLISIELQGERRRASGGREAHNLSVVVAPSEVIGPLLPAGMKQRRQFVCQRIAGFQLGVFVIVAALTRQR